MKDFRMKYEVLIDWSDLDLFEHVNNLKIMKYVQSARINYLEKVGLMPMDKIAKTGPILASLHTQFRQPILYPGTVTIYSRVDYIKTSSIKFHHEVYNNRNELVVEAQDIVVYYDFNKNHKLTIPQELRHKFEVIEQKSYDPE